MQTRLLIVVSIIFFISTSWLYFASPSVFNSPDEAASAAVIQQFTRGSGLWLPAVAADTQEIQNLVHPRSLQVIGDRLVPAGFIGLPVIYGAIAAMTHTRVLAFLTPLFALAGIGALYFLMLNVWGDRRVALWSAVMLALHPAFWYYSARGLFHNVLFMSLLLVGACAVAYRTVILRPKAEGSRTHDGNLTGSFSASRFRMTIIDTLAIIAAWLALLVRPSELWWVLALACVFLWWQRKTVTRKQFIWWLLVGGVLALATIVLYRYVYGDVSLAAVATQYGGGTEGVVNQAWWRWFLPFGFHPRVMVWSTVRWYGLLALPFTLLTLGGLVLILLSFWSPDSERSESIGTIESSRSLGPQIKNVRRWFWIFLAVTFWLIVVYGSWLIFDNPSRDVTIGGAYLRYWLPSFVLGAPFAGYAIVWLMEKLKNKWRVIASAAVMLTLAAFTFYVAVIRTDGVRDVGRAMGTGAAIRDALKTHDGGIPANAVILTDREDKFLVGEWQIIQPVKNHDNLRAVYELLNEGKPVFFVTPARTIDEWRDLKEKWFASARLMYTYWFSVGEYEVHALKRVSLPSS